ncbi:MAG: gas vesicle protein [Cyclobacteriaceae bacterium]|jgi:gas vesicle protein
MSNNSGGSFFTFLFGIAVGGVIGLLFAPERGSNTRDKLSFKLDKYKSKLEDLVNDIVEGKELVQNEAKSEGERIISDAKSKAEQLLDDVNGLITQIKSDNKSES